jgi:hypothetical protein
VDELTRSDRATLHGGERELEVDARPTVRHGPCRVLVTNDDGIDAPGLQLLAHALAANHEVVVGAAPSAASVVRVTWPARQHAVSVLGSAPELRSRTPSSRIVPSARCDATLK